MTLSLSQSPKCMNINQISCRHFETDPEIALRSHKLYSFYTQKAFTGSKSAHVSFKLSDARRPTTASTTTRFQFHFPRVQVHNVRTANSLYALSADEKSSVGLALFVLAFFAHFRFVFFCFYFLVDSSPHSHCTIGLWLLVCV